MIERCRVTEEEGAYQRSQQALDEQWDIEYELGSADCELGLPHEDKSEAYNAGYSDQYAKEQALSNGR